MELHFTCVIMFDKSLHSLSLPPPLLFRSKIMINMVYFTYMTFIDVPQYIKGHIINTANGKTYYNIPDGLNTLLNVSQHKWTWSYCDWKYAMCWMTLYFSFACWASVGVINAPRLDQGLVKQKTK